MLSRFQRGRRLTGKESTGPGQSHSDSRNPRPELLRRRPAHSRPSRCAVAGLGLQRRADRCSRQRDMAVEVDDIAVGAYGEDQSGLVLDEPARAGDVVLQADLPVRAVRVEEVGPTAEVVKRDAVGSEIGVGGDVHLRSHEVAAGIEEDAVTRGAHLVHRDGERAQLGLGEGVLARVCAVLHSHGCGRSRSGHSDHEEDSTHSRPRSTSASPRLKISASHRDAPPARERSP